MSAYIVEDKTINRIVTYIMTNGDMFYERTQLAKLGYTNPVPLGEAMFKLNCKSVEERYGKGEAKKFRKLDYHYQPVECSRMVAFKALRCYLYQSCEGKCEETKLYKALEEISGKIAIYIVRDLPAYDTAEGW